MRHNWDDSILCSAFEQPLSLDYLTDTAVDEDGLSEFDIRDQRSSPAEQLDLARDAHAVGAFVRSLGAREQRILSAVFWVGKTQTAVAAELGVSKMAISKIIKKILKRGRRELAAYRDSALLH